MACNANAKSLSAKLSVVLTDGASKRQVRNERRVKTLRQRCERWIQFDIRPILSVHSQCLDCAMFSKFLQISLFQPMFEPIWADVSRSWPKMFSRSWRILAKETPKF